MELDIEAIATELIVRHKMSHSEAMEKIQAWIDGELRELEAVDADYGSLCELFLEEFGFDPYHYAHYILD